jgi:DNA-binding HxlR family transcriptional regulator
MPRSVLGQAWVWLVQDLKRMLSIMSSAYGQFCPVSKAAEIVCERWSPLIIRELLSGSSRFNEIRRGLPTCSSAILSQRLKTLERAGVVTRSIDAVGPFYTVTPAGWELFPLIKGLGEWGQRWARSDYTDEDLDPGLLLWDVRRFLSPEIAAQRVVLMVHFPTAAAKRRRYWFVIDDAVDLCMTEPGWPVDVTITADLKALTQVWMGDRTFADAVRSDAIGLEGDRQLIAKIPEWWGQHPILGPVASAVPA